MPTETVAPGHYLGKWIVVTGIRDMRPGEITKLNEKMKAAVAGGAAGIIFGGARGVDTLALRCAFQARAAAYGRAGPGETYAPPRWAGAPHTDAEAGPRPKFVVIVPATVAQQPRDAQATINAEADEVIELGLDLTRGASFHTRNGKMITEGRLRDPEEKPIIFAFPAADAEGGTRATMKVAAQWGLTIEETVVARTPGGAD